MASGFGFADLVLIRKTQLKNNNHNYYNDNEIRIYGLSCV